MSIRDVDHGSYEISDEVSPDCPACGGMVIQLGTLGASAVWRCRGCGSTVTIAEPKAAVAPAAPRTTPRRRRP